MTNILIPGSLPSASEATIEELLLEFEDEFRFQDGCMQVDNNTEIGRLVDILRDNPRIDARESRLVLKTAVMIFISLQRQGQILDPNYKLSQVSKLTLRKIFKESSKDREGYRQRVFNDMYRENKPLYLYVEKQIVLDKIVYLNNLVERYASVVYSALREQESKRGVGELEWLHNKVAMAYSSRNFMQWKFYIG